VIGGHLIGLAAGAVAALVPARGSVAGIAQQALAVGLSLFVMAVARAEHPPAAGTALTVALYGISWQTGVAVLVSVSLLVLIQRLVRPYLGNDERHNHESSTRGPRSGPWPSS
jgi:CBS-domain-containing membrane protein